MLIDNYESFPPGYPGGYGQLKIDYKAHLEDNEARLRDRKGTPSEYLTQGHLGNFLAGRGVFKKGLEEEFGRYAEDRLSPLSDQYYDVFTGYLVDRLDDDDVNPLPSDRDPDSFARSFVPAISRVVASKGEFPVEVTFDEVCDSWAHPQGLDPVKRPVDRTVLSILDTEEQ